METFVYLGLISLNKRFEEVRLILDEAKNNFEKNEQLYNALCRSAQMLISAHFEGYLKDFIKNSLEDINQNSTFKSANPSLKQRFCEHFIHFPKEESKEKWARIKELIEVFDSLDTKFKKEYFMVYDNQNPKVTVIDKMANQFGVKNFFKQIKKSNLDWVFSNTNTENIKYRDNLKKYLVENTKKYPYNLNIDFIEIKESIINSDNLWEAFLSDLLKRRHAIAHGTETENSVDSSVIESDLVKIEILIYVFTLLLCINCNPVDEL